MSTYFKVFVKYYCCSLLRNCCRPISISKSSHLLIIADPANLPPYKNGISYFIIYSYFLLISYFIGNLQK